MGKIADMRRAVGPWHIQRGGQCGRPRAIENAGVIIEVYIDLQFLPWYTGWAGSQGQPSSQICAARLRVLYLA